MTQRHPLDQLRAEEIGCARDVVRQAWPGAMLQFRSIFLEEPTKASLIPFLEAEHAGALSSGTPRPPRLARVQYSVIQPGGTHGYTESIVDVDLKKEISQEVFDSSCQPFLTM